VLASPLVKRMAQEQNIDLSQVQGSGPGVVSSDRILMLTRAKLVVLLLPKPAATASAEPAVPPAVAREAGKNRFSHAGHYRQTYD